MKKCFIFIFSILISISTLAQSPYNDIKLESQEDYKKAETSVLKATSYLFSSKYDKEDLERLYAIEFIMKWMGGTTDYSFDLSEKFMAPFQTETDLLGLYMGAIAKFVLENKADSKNTNKVNVTAAKTVIDYSSKPANNLKQTGELKKMAAASKKGELEKYFGI